MQTEVQSNSEVDEESKRNVKKPSRFDNVFFDSLYNIIAYIPVAIISWVISTLDLE